MADSDDEETLKAVADEPEEEEAPEDTTLANCDVVTKYQEAARIVNAAMAEIAALVTTSHYLILQLRILIPCTVFSVFLVLLF